MPGVDARGMVDVVHDLTGPFFGELLFELPAGVGLRKAILRNRRLDGVKERVHARVGLMHCCNWPLARRVVRVDARSQIIHPDRVQVKQPTRQRPQGSGLGTCVWAC